MTHRLDGKVAVITGAASGIGLATLELFVAQGARVVAADRDKEEGVALESRFPGKVHFECCDVTQLGQLKSAIESASTHFGQLDILVNNAGSGGSVAGVENFDEAGWDSTQALLLRAVAAGTSYALPHMKQNGGAIVNVSSIAAFQAGYAYLSYSVAKAGVAHYTKVAAAELSAYGIRINAVAPGFTATRIFGSSLGMSREDADNLAQHALARTKVPSPLGVAGKPSDIAESIFFLVSDASSYITGTCLTVDGGTLIGPRHSWDVTERSPIEEIFDLTEDPLASKK